MIEGCSHLVLQLVSAYSYFYSYSNFGLFLKVVSATFLLVHYLYFYRNREVMEEGMNKLCLNRG